MQVLKNKNRKWIFIESIATHKTHMATCHVTGAPTGPGRLRCLSLLVIRLRPLWLASVGNRSLCQGCCLAGLGLSSFVVRRRRRRRRRQHQSLKNLL